MSLLGVDVGTTGCKATVFSSQGEPLGYAYEEYDVQRPQLRWAELDVWDVWEKVKRTIRAAASGASADPVQALAVSSLGEAMVPVSKDRKILGPSILGEDARGEAYLEHLRSILDDARLYQANGNALGNHYGLTKLLWLKEHQPGIFQKAHKFLLWGSFVPYMLGARAAVDYSLANRTLLFDLNAETWSQDLLGRVGLDEGKLPMTCPAGAVIGTVAPSVATDLGLTGDTVLVAGAHDQCANAVGCGAIHEGRTMLGMGTYLCMAPTYERRKDTALMMSRGLNTEHHAAPGLFVSYIYNQGGVLLKWYRDTFAASEHCAAAEKGEDIYPALLSEMPVDPSDVFVLPHFMTTGPPEFVADSSGVITGLHVATNRGEILKGVLEGAVFYLRGCVESLPETGIPVFDFRAVGGGSKSDAWVQICADILGASFVRPKFTEAGVLGAAILAGVGAGVYSSVAEGVEVMVEEDRRFDPNPKAQRRYDERFDEYRQLWPLMRDFLTP